MTRRLLDTTFLIDYWTGTDATEAFLTATAEESEYITTTLNLKELAVGKQLQGTNDPAVLKSTFDWVRIVPFELEHALRAGEFEAELFRSDTYTRRQIDALPGDVLVAAVASELDARVVTRNVDDFSAFGVAVESY